jgi:DNA-binding transcriptional regulator YiaG
LCQKAIVPSLFWLSPSIDSKVKAWFPKTKMTARGRDKKKKRDIYERYRRILKMPDLTNKEIDEMREKLGLLARTICEHVWGKRFY